MKLFKQLFLKKLTGKQILVRMLLILTIYVLSIAPMFWMWYESMYLSGPRWVARLYYPLALACNIFPIFSKWINAYIVWWWS
ncbi:MAG: hypothetical protein ACKVT0_16190 [Planctomycetaceae bacterium]